LNPTLRVFASDQTYLVSKNPLSFAKSVYAQLPLKGDSLKALLKDMDCERILVEGGAVNPLFPLPDRLRSVFSALDEKANS
jgi:hypothetical protein